MVSTTPIQPETPPPTWRWVVGFLLVGMAWGLTTPFMRKGAISKEKKPAPKRPILNDADVSWIRRTVLSIVYSVVDLLKNPAYAIPLLLNVTGSVWFFLLIGQAGEYLVMDILRSSLNVYRIEPHSTNHQFSSLPIYSAGRVVGGG